MEDAQTKADNNMDSDCGNYPNNRSDSTINHNKTEISDL